MKKVKFVCIILIGIMALPFINGCKKGDQDPFLSLRSRDGRLIKEWKLTKVEGTYIFSRILPSPDYTKTINYSYDGSTYNKITSVDTTSNTVTETYTGSYAMSLKEDGSVSVEEVLTSSGVTSTTTTRTYKGTWVWVTGNKKKDHLSIEISGFTLFNGGILYVSRLAHKEMVLKTSTSNSSATGTYSNSTTSDYTFTFEPK